MFEQLMVPELDALYRECHGYDVEGNALPEMVAAVEGSYRGLVREIGVGFHPDTRGVDYAPSFDAVAASRYERIVEAAFDVLDDAYAVALNEIELL